MKLPGFGGAVKQDTISITLVCIAICVSVLQFTLDPSGDLLYLFPSVLASLGIGLQIMLEWKFPRAHVERVAADKRRWGEIVMFTALCILGFWIVSLGIPFKPASTINLSGVVNSGCEAIAETEFFQCFVLNALLLVPLPMPGRANRSVHFKMQAQPWYLAAAEATLIAGVFHIGRYGGDWNSMYYVLGGFLIINCVCIWSGVVSPGMLGHLFNNIKASLSIVLPIAAVAAPLIFKVLFSLGGIVV